MKIVEWHADGPRVMAAAPAQIRTDGFLWVALERVEFMAHLGEIQDMAHALGGSSLLDLHIKDLANATHPSDYDATSIYDLVVFRRLAGAQNHRHGGNSEAEQSSPETARIPTQAIGFAIFDRLLISVHPPGFPFAERVLAAFAAPASPAADAAQPSVRPRPARHPADLTLRIISAMVDEYLELCKDIGRALKLSESALLQRAPRQQTWSDLIETRSRLRLLQELCEDQHDTMQEWLEVLREPAPNGHARDARQARRRHDELMARARDVMEHIDRVRSHAHRLEQSAETAVQIHFNAQGQRTNDILLVLTAITVIFLPLNLFTGFFGMNFDHLPLLHSSVGMWISLAAMVVLAAAIVAVFWRKHYLGDKKAPAE